jgi:RNA polymerase sigma-70 factor (ECF subfamily)
MAGSPIELIPTRATLLERLKNWQDQSSWQDFFETYWHLIYGVARQRGLTDSEAQDVVQETLISVSKHMPAFKYDPAIGSFKAWLLNMTRWRIADQLRKRAIHVSNEEVNIETLAGMEKTWDDEWEKTLLDVAIAKAKQRLNPKQYMIFDYYVNKEWEPERVAKAMSVSVDVVYKTKQRVTEAIKEEVDRLRKREDMV